MMRIVPVLFIPLLIVACKSTNTPQQQQQRQLDKQIAAYKALGEPIEPADFNVHTAADKDNAVPELCAACKAIARDEDSPSWQAYQKLSDIALPLTDVEAEAIRAAALAEVVALVHLDNAMTKPAVDWRINLTSPVIYTEIPELNDARMLADIVADRALLKHQTGNDAVAVADIGRVIFISRAVGKVPAMTAHLASQTILRQAARRAEQIAPDLRIGTKQGEASPQAVSELIAAVLDDAPTHGAQFTALLTDRMLQLDSARCIIDGRLDVPKLMSIPGSTEIRPLPEKIVFDRETGSGDALILIRRATDFAYAARASHDWPSLKSKLPTAPPPELSDRSKHIVLAMFMPDPTTLLRHDYLITAHRRMAAVALAIRAYAVDHDGRRPAQLSDLVPKYLLSIPLDPMTDGQPLQYNADQAIVSCSGANAGDGDNAVLHLDRQPRPAPSTAP